MIETATKETVVGSPPQARPSGPAMAVLLSAGIGCFAIGLATVLASASPAIKNTLNWWNPAGPLTGKTGVGVIAWVLAWGALHLVWRKKEITYGRIWAITLALVILGWVLTFPPVFEAFERH